jgi:hypothetical protein
MVLHNQHPARGRGFSTRTIRSPTLLLGPQKITRTDDSTEWVSQNFSARLNPIDFCGQILSIFGMGLFVHLYFALVRDYFAGKAGVNLAHYIAGLGGTFPYHPDAIASIVSLTSLATTLGGTLATTAILNIFNNALYQARIRLNGVSVLNSGFRLMSWFSLEAKHRGVSCFHFGPSRHLCGLVSSCL